ncbi:MAG: TIGR01620 family protein [Rhodoblastus sp.]
MGDARGRGPVRALRDARLDRRRPRGGHRPRAARAGLARIARDLPPAPHRHPARRARASARDADDRDAARAGAGELLSLYAGRPDTARARALVKDLTREIVDGRDLVDIAERNLMAPLDAEANREIAAAAKRVSMVTAISPRALVDVLFVGAQAIRLLRRIAEIYGGRPGLLGFLRLARSVGAHLAITGGMAIGDSLVQQVVGHGIAARLSARLGEGVLNGMLTTRIGLSAMAVCRPMPFAALRQPGVKDVAPFLFGDGK